MKRQVEDNRSTTSASPAKRRRSASKNAVKLDPESASDGGSDFEEDEKPAIKTESKKRQPKNANGPSPGGWTPAKRGAFIEKVLSAGYKALDLDEVAKELELNKRQLINQLTSGRAGNFRDKCIKHITGAE